MAQKMTPIISNEIDCLDDQYFQWIFIHILYALLNFEYAGAQLNSKNISQRWLKFI
jgi:hypothetical protein